MENDDWIEIPDAREFHPLAWTLAWVYLLGLWL